jgi:hypothetical protein
MQPDAVLWPLFSAALSWLSVTQDIWNILFLIAAVLALVVGIVVPWYQARGSRKELAYEYDATRLADPKQVSSKLKMTFDGHPVFNVSLIRIKIRNSGRVPITRDDFDEPISIEIVSDGLLSVESGKSSPPSLEYELASLPDRKDIQLGTLLLNPTDEINLSVLATGFRKVAVKGRIVGLKQIKQKEPAATASKVPIFLVGMAGVFSALLGYKLGASNWGLLPFLLLVLNNLLLGVAYRLSSKPMR